jgi:hypothetical protein
MEAIFSTLTDSQRATILNNLYQKGISTPKEDLAFASEKLIYIQPFISKLLSEGDSSNLATRIMVREVVDQLLKDIIDEISVRIPSNQEQVMKAYGLNDLSQGEDSYYAKQVA